MTARTDAEPDLVAPLEAPRRVPSLDVLRGIAIIGTLASNIGIFTAQLQANEQVFWLADLLRQVPNGKFLGLLTIMFGIGLEIQRQSARRAGRSWPGSYPVRAGLLFLDGVVNYVLVVQFDVLRAYAVTGLVVAFLLLTSERVQLWIAAVFVGLHIAIMAGYLSPGAEGAAGGGVVVPQGFSDEDLDSGSPTGHGYLDTVRSNLENMWMGFSWGSEFSTIVVMGVAMFLLGACLYRHGVFEPAGRRMRRCLIVVGLLVALPLDLASAAGLFGLDEVLWSWTRYGTAAVAAFGILALVAEYYQHRPVGRIGRRLADVGVMALSCYLLQNILGVLLSSHVTPRFDLSPVGALLGTGAAFLGISAVLVVFATLWLRRFRRGPFEMVLDRLFRVITRA